MSTRGWLILRRIVHMTGPCFMVYYVLPEYIVASVRKEWLFITGLVVLCGIELHRLKNGWTVAGLRPYERTRLGAYFWWAIGLVMALFLFPQKYVVPVIIGSSFIDPMIGELRARQKLSKLYPVLPAAAYAAIVAFSLLFLTSEPALNIVVLTIVGSISAILSEWKKFVVVDDDFLMIIVPLTAMTATAWMLQFVRA